MRSPRLKSPVETIPPSLVLCERQLDRRRGAAPRRVADLAERARDHQRRLAAEPGLAAVPLATEARLAVHDARAREEEAAEIVPGGVQGVGHEDLHGTQVLHAVHVAVGVS